MPRLTYVRFNEYSTPSCCGGAEVGGLSLMPKASWDEAIKELTNYINTQGMNEGVYDWDSLKFVPSQHPSFTFHRRLVVYYAKNPSKEQLDAFKKYGWEVGRKFPGNHGHYSMFMLTYIPNIKSNKRFLEKINKESSTGTNSGNGSNVDGPKGVSESDRKEVGTGSDEGGVPVKRVRRRAKATILG